MLRYLQLHTFKGAHTDTQNPMGIQGFAAIESHEKTPLFLIMPVILLCLLCHGELLCSIRLERH